MSNEELEECALKIFMRDVALESNPKRTLRDWFEELGELERCVVTEFLDLLVKAKRLGVSPAQVRQLFQYSEEFLEVRAEIHEKLGRPTPPPGYKTER
jgi:hypothetical protein